MAGALQEAACTLRFEQLAEAKAVLTDPPRRRDHDLALSGAAHPPAMLRQAAACFADAPARSAGSAAELLLDPQHGLLRCGYQALEAALATLLALPKTAFAVAAGGCALRWWHWFKFGGSGGGGGGV